MWVVDYDASAESSCGVRPVTNCSCRPPTPSILECMHRSTYNFWVGVRPLSLLWFRFSLACVMVLSNREQRTWCYIMKRWKFLRSFCAGVRLDFYYMGAENEEYEPEKLGGGSCSAAIMWLLPSPVWLQFSILEVKEGPVCMHDAWLCVGFARKPDRLNEATTLTFHSWLAVERKYDEHSGLCNCNLGSSAIGLCPGIMLSNWKGPCISGKGAFLARYRFVSSICQLRKRFEKIAVQDHGLKKDHGDMWTAAY